MVDFNVNFNPSLRPQGVPSRMALSANALRAPSQVTPPQPAQRSPEEMAMLRNNMEMQAAAAAQQRLNAGGWRGTGILGAPIASWLEGRRQRQNLGPYTQQEMARLENALALSDAEAGREFTNQNAQTAFGEALRRETNQLTFDRDAAREDALLSAANAREDAQIAAENQREDAQIAAEWARQDQQLAERLAREDRLSAEERERAMQLANNERAWTTLAQEDEQFGILYDRFKEIRGALPTLARMAGVDVTTLPDEDPLKNLLIENNPLYQNEEVWNDLKRWTGGTGPGAGFGWLANMSFRPESSRVTDLANTEAINRLSSLDTPLTPVSDADIRLVMGMGISPQRTEESNYKEAVDTILALQKELEMRAAAAGQSLNPVRNPSSAPPSTRILEVRPVGQAQPEARLTVPNGSLLAPSPGPNGGVLPINGR